MLKQEDTGGIGGGGGGVRSNNWARACDTCRSAACTVYCKADSAYLCSGCDSRIHAANKVASRHERVWICESCEKAPAAFLCKADAASLCATCDSDIHSANPLARRHHRVPILPIPLTTGCLYGGGGGGGPMIGHTATADEVEDDFNLTPVAAGEGGDDTTIDEDDENEAASWLLLNPVKNYSSSNEHNNGQGNNNNNIGGIFGGEGVDEYLDLVDYQQEDNNQFGDHEYVVSDEKNRYGVGAAECVVPSSRNGDGKEHHHHHHHLHQFQNHQSFQLGLDYEISNNTGYGYPASITHTVSTLH